MKPLNYTERMYVFIEANPGCNTNDLMPFFGPNKRAIQNGMNRLMRQSMVVICKTKRDGLLTYKADDGQSDSASAKQQVRQRVVTSWPAVTVPQQSPWSSLGI